MGLIRGKNWWWNYFKKELFSIFSHVRGSITVMNGYSEMEINIDPSIQAERIFVAVEAEGIPVCGANVNMVGAIKKGDNAFIIYADIKSNTATIYWLVDYKYEGPDESIDDI